MSDMKLLRSLFAVIFTLLGCYACQDDDYPLPQTDIPSDIPTRAADARKSSLTQGADGYWTASKRIPLVGQGRIVDDIAAAVVSVANWNDDIQKIIDLDITNSVSFSGVATVQTVENQLVSVRDVIHTYAGGQNAGFVYKMTDSSVLTLNVLKGFKITTFLNGVKQESAGGTGESGVLELNLLTIANDDGKQALSISTSFDKPFDEILLSVVGVSATVLGNFNLFYAFVGDNPVEPAITSNTTYFPNGVEIHKGSSWTNLLGSENLINDDLTDGAGFGVLAISPRIAVNFKKEIPVGTEIGFQTTEGSALDLSLFSGTLLETYDANNKKVESITLGSLLGLSVISGGRKMVSMVTSKPGATQIYINFGAIIIKLGATVINFAYARNPVEVDASSYFALADEKITGNAYQFAAPSSGKMEYIVVSSPQGTAPKVNGSRISGMTKNGDYQIMAVYTTGDGSVFSQTMTITREAKTTASADCNHLIAKPEYPNASIYIPAGGGSLLSLEGMTDGEKEALVNADPNDYLEYTQGISVAGNYAIIGVKAGRTITPTADKLRVGFTIQASTSVLDLSALRFLRIVLKKDGMEVDRAVADENNAVSLGLIGNSGGRIRMSMATDKEFDAVELWTSGVLNLNLSVMRMYNAFTEPATEDCSTGEVTDACLELITMANSNASINYAETKTLALANVATTFSNLGNLLDADKNTTAKIYATTVGGATTLAVKFNPIQGVQQIGFIVKEPAYGLSADVISAITIKAYSAGVEVGNNANWGVAGVGVIGYSGMKYLYTVPQTRAQIDEVRFTLGSLVNALDFIELGGVFVRRDSDGDGILDCAEEETTDDLIFTSAIAKAEQICEGSPIEIEVEGGIAGTEYLLKFNDVSLKNNDFEQRVALAASSIVGKNIFTIPSVATGEYYIGLYDISDTNNPLYNGIHVTVHPSETTWKTSPASTDWNEWNNWTNGSPWDCTNVIIPAGCTLYPQLEAGADNYCQYIHFEYGGEVVNTHYLNYQKAWVELALQPGRYYMLSAPLKSMMTGDLFIPANRQGDQSTTEKFTVLDQTTSPENRFSPRIYQRFWSSNADGKKISGGSLTTVIVTPDKTNWTAPFNALNTAYKVGMGFSARVEKENLALPAIGKLTFRFPKEHTQYTYFNLNGASTGKTESVSRSSAGRFIYESDGNTAALPLKVTATNIQAGSTYLMGNPFMTHINIQKFLEENTNITSIKVYDGNRNNSMILADGVLLGNGDTYRYIAPMQSFFVTAAEGTTLTARFTEAMLLQVPGNTTRTLTRSAVPTQPEGTLQLTATAPGNVSSTALLRISAQADDAYRATEDVKSLFDSEVQPALSVFTEAGGNALDIQQINGSRIHEIPVGFSLKSGTNVRLAVTMEAGNTWQGWSLEDRQTGKRYPLSHSGIQIDLGHISTHIGRLYLVKRTK